MPTPSRRPVDRQPAPFRRPDPVRTYTVLLKTMPNLWSSLQRGAITRTADDAALVHRLLRERPRRMEELRAETGLPRRRLDRALFAGRAVGLWVVRNEGVHGAPHRYEWSAVRQPPYPENFPPRPVLLDAARRAGYGGQTSLWSWYPVILFYSYRICTSPRKIPTRTRKSCNFTGFSLNTKLLNKSRGILEGSLTEPCKVGFLGKTSCVDLSGVLPIPSVNGFGTLPVIAKVRQTWADAHRVALGKKAYSLRGTCYNGALSSNPGERSAWRGFGALAGACHAWGADLREVCLAAAHHRRRTGKSVTPWQMAGDYGRGLWQEWREREADKAGDKAHWREGWITSAAEEVRSPEAELVAEFRLRRKEAERYPWNVTYSGAHGAAWVWCASQWGGEAYREWAAAAVADGLAFAASRPAEDGPRFLREWAALRGNPTTQRAARSAWDVASSREGVGQ